MAKRKSKTPDSELQDAIERIGRQREAQMVASNSTAWQDYLKNVLGVSPESMSTKKNQSRRSGADFWDDVRNGIIEDKNLQPERQSITERQVAEANAHRELLKNGRVTYRSNETGRFIKINR